MVSNPINNSKLDNSLKLNIKLKKILMITRTIIGSNSNHTHKIKADQYRLSLKEQLGIISALVYHQHLQIFKWVKRFLLQNP